jgi:hypothetical protein
MQTLLLRKDTQNPTTSVRDYRSTSLRFGSSVKQSLLVETKSFSARVGKVPSSHHHLFRNRVTLLERYIQNKAEQVLANQKSLVIQRQAKQVHSGF